MHRLGDKPCRGRGDVTNTRVPGTATTDEPEPASEGEGVPDGGTEEEEADGGNVQRSARSRKPNPLVYGHTSSFRFRSQAHVTGEEAGWLLLYLLEYEEEP